MAEITIQNLFKKFDDVTAVDRISLTIRSGEFLSLVGPSGCGKTTTLNLIAGFIHPDSGEILIDGEPMNDIPIHKRGLGMVFQSYALFPHMTVRDNIAFGLRMRKQDQASIMKEVQRALDLVRLPGVENRYPRQLSGGQQQRIALARALVIHPKVLLLDEPLSNLDAKLRKEMRIELKEIQKTVGTTTIFVTHDQEEALSLSDRMAVMNRGRVEQLGLPIEIYESPMNEFVSSFIGESNILSGSVLGYQERYLTVDVGEGRPMAVALPASGNVQTGDKVRILVRPEKLRFVAESEQTVNSLHGTIDHVVFLGNMTYYTIKMESRSLAVLSQNLETKPYSAGERVVLTIHPNHCRVLREEELP